jgi:hypothetical protein
VQWRKKESQHKLAAAMLAVANTKHAVWRFASSHAAGGGLTAEELAQLLKHRTLPVRSSRSTSRAPMSQVADARRLASIFTNVIIQAEEACHSVAIFHPLVVSCPSGRRAALRLGRRRRPGDEQRPRRGRRLGSGASAAVCKVWRRSLQHLPCPALLCTCLLAEQTWDHQCGPRQQL